MQAGVRSRLTYLQLYCNQSPGSHVSFTCSNTNQLILDINFKLIKMFFSTYSIEFHVLYNQLYKCHYTVNHMSEYKMIKFLRQKLC